MGNFPQPAETTLVSLSFVLECMGPLEEGAIDIGDFDYQVTCEIGYQQGGENKTITFNAGSWLLSEHYTEDEFLDAIERYHQGLIIHAKEYNLLLEKNDFDGVAISYLQKEQ